MFKLNKIFFALILGVLLVVSYSSISEARSSRNVSTKIKEQLEKLKEQDDEVFIEENHEDQELNKKIIFPKPEFIPARKDILEERLKYKKRQLTTRLSREYQKLSKRLTLLNNWTDASYFRRKGNDADTLKDILPENPQSVRWVIDDDLQLEQLISARYTLVGALSTNAYMVTPNAAAKSIVYYDCWVSQSQNSWSDDTTNCKQAYFKVFSFLREAAEETRLLAIAEILDNYKLVDAEATFFPYAEDVVVENEPYEGNYGEEMKILVEEKLKDDEQKLRQASGNTAPDANAGFVVDNSGGDSPELVYVIYFAGKSKALTGRAKDEIDKSVAAIKKNAPSMVIINGHTDRSFDANNSLIVSKTRADAVKDYIISKGVDASVVRSFGFGMTDNAVENSAGEKQPANNRAEIIFEGSI